MAKISKNQVRVSTRNYEWAHGRKPRGYGFWCFTIDGTDFFWTGTYTETKKLAVEMAVSLNVRNIEVGS